MSIPGSASPLFLSAAAAAAPAGYEIERSLRFNSNDSANLSKNFASAGNRKTWTFSAWLKLTNLTPSWSTDQQGTIFSASGSLGGGATIRNNGGLRFAFGADPSGTDYYRETVALFRDPSAWYHCVWVQDTTQSTGNRWKIYVNGVLQTLQNAGLGEIGLNATPQINNTVNHNIGSYVSKYDGYLADIHFIDGQALAPTDFGEFDANGVWQPKEVSITSPNDGTTWSSYLSSPAGFSTAATFAFDNDIFSKANTPANTGGLFTGETNAIEFIPPSSIPFTSSVKVTGRGTGQTTAKARIDTGSGYGNEISLTSDGIETLISGSGNLVKLKIWTVTYAGENELGAILIDDVPLVDGVGQYGTNGFHLPFSDNSSNAALGDDSSGNNNDWTVNNIVAEQPLSLPAVGQTQAGNSYLSVPASDDFNFGTGDFTIEFFLYVIRSGGNNAIFDFRDSGSSDQYFLRMTSSTSCNLRYSGTDLGTFSITSGSWNHVAISRSSGTTKIFVDGAQTNSFSDTNDASNTGPLLFGTFNDTTGSSSSYGFDGQISNLRIVKGTAVYTSAFTTPTAPLTNITNTKLLCCQSSSSATAAAVSPGTITASNSFPTNFSDSTSANDSLVDSPTNGTQTDTGAGNEVVGNYCTLNPLDNATTLSNGNLTITGSGSAFKGVRSTIGMSSGKWYMECTMTAYSSSTSSAPGIWNGDDTDLNTGAGSYGNAYLFVTDYASNYRIYVNKGASNPYSEAGSISAGDIIGIALDLDNGECYVHINGTYLNSGSSVYSTWPADTYYFGGYEYTTGNQLDFNFGQRAFAYTAPSGFKALCTTNLTDPTIADGSDYFDVALDTGANILSSTKALCNGNADFLWIKDRDNSSTNHHLIDIVRDPQLDGTPFLASNSTSDETTLGTYSAPSGNSVGWAWDAGSSTVSNTDGSITSSVRANASAGFSIVSWTSNGTAGIETVGHGLGVEPDLIIVKNRDATSDWQVFHSSFGNTASDYLYLNQTAAKATSGATIWSRSSTTFGFRQSSLFANNEKAIAYCFASVAGYSAFGSYTGNGSATDGVFVHTGHRARFLMIKRTDSSGNWIMHDTARDTYNVADKYLLANSSGAEASGTGILDILSNGFKARNTWLDLNASGGTYIYAAFGDPFKTARAR